MNLYQKFVSRFTDAIQEAKSFPLGDLTPAPRPSVTPDVPKALFFSPHPDDECISGGIALRLLREAQMNVLNVAVTQGSKKERQAERLHELQGACNYLGFGLITTVPDGMERINPKTRTQDHAHRHLFSGDGRAERDACGLRTVPRRNRILGSNN